MTRPLSYDQSYEVARRVAPTNGDLVHFDNDGMTVAAPAPTATAIVFAAQRGAGGALWVEQVSPRSSRAPDA